MSDVKRPYRADYRKRQSEHQSETTQRVITEAARTLFTRDGYGATTIERIAREAGVAVPTVYANFGTKRRIFEKLIEFAQADPALARLLERAVGEDAATQLRLAASFNRVFFTKNCDLLEALVGAAASDPALAELREGHEQGRQDRALRFARALKNAGRLRAGLSESDAAATIFALSGHEPFRLLVRRSGWSPEEYETWLLATFDALILRGPARPDGRKVVRHTK